MNNIEIRAFLMALNSKKNNTTLSSLSDDLKQPNRPIYVKDALSQFYDKIGFGYDKILPQKLIFSSLIAIDYLINNNDFPDIHANTSIKQLAESLGNATDPCRLNQINFEEELRKNFSRRIIYEDNNVSIISMVGNIFDNIDKFNVACLHNSVDAPINEYWNNFQTEIIEQNRIEYDLLENNKIPRQRMLSILPSKNLLNYIYLFPDNRVVNGNHQDIQNRLFNCLNQVIENAPLARSLVFNGFLTENDQYREIIRPFFNVLINYFQENNETNIKTIYIISKKDLILEL
jgi:hypothetical protein